MSAGRDEIVAMVADVFADLGALAVYTPVAGAPVPDLRIAPRMVDIEALDSIGMPTLQKGRVFSLLRTDVAERPVAGASIEIVSGEGAQPGVYPVLEDALCEDRYQLVWLCRVGEPA